MNRKSPKTQAACTEKYAVNHLWMFYAESPLQKTQMPLGGTENYHEN